MQLLFVRRISLQHQFNSDAYLLGSDLPNECCSTSIGCVGLISIGQESHELFHVINGGISNQSEDWSIRRI